MNAIDFDRAVGRLVELGWTRATAERQLREHHGGPAVVVDPIDHDALEKQHEAAADRLMQELGFAVIRFSHPGKTKQTEGIADRRYYRRPRVVGASRLPDGREFPVLSSAITLWFEAKSGSGRQRPGQQVFEELVTACGEAYVCGTRDTLVDWLVAHQIARRVGDAGDQLEAL